ncbi:MAG: IS21 family transposase [Balneolaceae bacterium]|nr:IS21 family transposase [Balneolaceae bacterium]
MTSIDLSNWIMYHEIHQLARLGFSKAKIARHLVADVRTIGKYLNMTEDEFGQFLLNSRQRTKKLSGYEEFVRARLVEYPDTSTAQMHDWLKEQYPDFPLEIPPRTVYNFVMYVRGQHNIPVATTQRDYFPVEELSWGEQGQVDFGEYNMRRATGVRKKVYFFVMVLSRSRMKYLWFSDGPFTSTTVCQAHEQAFAFFGGIPATIVYDLDRILVVDENMGQILLTNAFKQYVASRGFKLYFCRKADPESKGKVENVVGYVKKNFLLNRAYVDQPGLNTQALAWLGRTANFLPHNVTKQSPQSQHLIEQQHLTPYHPIPVKKQPRPYHVRKDNTISYKSNFYTLPEGTYQGRGSQVLLQETGNGFTVYGVNETLICTHELAAGKGKTIINTNHRRDTSRSLEELTGQAAGCFSDPDRARSYIARIQQKLPRYIRDHLQCIVKALDGVDAVVADETLAFCLKNELYSGSEFEQVLQVHRHQPTPAVNPHTIKGLSTDHVAKASQAPQTSNLDDYETIINPNPNTTPT